jgi:hypothetical protein
MADQWRAEPSGPGMFGRLLIPQAGTKPAVTAFLAGLAGTGAFVASLVMKWQRITIADLSELTNGPSRNELVITAGLGSIDVLGLVYLLGSLALIAILGSVLVRPDQALRLRMGAAGLGIGILGVLVAITFRLPETILNIQGAFGGLSTQLQQELVDGSDIAYEAGLFAGFAAVVLLTAGVWLAAAPAARAIARATAYAGASYPGFDPAPAPGAPALPNGAMPGATAPAGEPMPAPPASMMGPASTPTWPISRAGQVDGLSVSASEPLDPGTATEVWRG